MSKEELTLIEYLDSFSKMLGITSQYLQNLGELEEKDNDKFEEFNEIMQKPEKFFELAKKKSPELSKTLMELFALFGSLSEIENPMELNAKEKKEQAKKLKEKSEKMATLSKKLKGLVKEKGTK